ncbi:MAG: hypothetical protein V7742_21270 [Halioglobus sp.]
MEEVQGLITAIEGLKGSPSIFKDYVFPVIAPLASAGFGAWFGYQAAGRRQGTIDEVKRLHILNRWVLEAEGCFRNLESIKLNYSPGIGNNPTRGISFGPQISDYLRANTDVSDLVFITKTLDRDIKKLDQTKLAYNNLPRIRQIFHNYNQVLTMWEKRNELLIPMTEKLRPHTRAGLLELSLEELFQVIPREEVALICHLTETALQYTDDGLIEMLGFMSEFPDLVKDTIDAKVRKNEGGVMSVLNDPKVTGMIVKRIPPVDEEAAIQVFGREFDV